MKTHCRHSIVILLTLLFVPNCFILALTRVPIHVLVQEADIVVIGTVKSTLEAHDVTEDGLNRRFGRLFRIQVDKMLYGKVKTKRSIFSKSDVGEINMDLNRNRKRKTVNLFAFQSVKSMLKIEGLHIPKMNA